MPDSGSWLESLPWKGIGISAGSALAVALGGLFTKGQVEDKLETARAPSAVQQEHTARHFDWKESCPLVGEDRERGAQLRVCPNDDCLMFIVVRGGLRQVFFSVAPEEIPTAPMVLGLFDFPGQSVEAAFPDTCLAEHGPPNGDPPFVDGADLGNGWYWQHARWRDGCRMSRQFHGPTQSATAWAWDTCSEQHWN